MITIIIILIIVTTSFHSIVARNHQTHTSTSSTCFYYEAEELIHRLDYNIATCFGNEYNKNQFNSISDIVMINEYDKHKPLSFIAFSNTTQNLHQFAAVFKNAVFKKDISKDAVQIIDLQATMVEIQSNGVEELKNIIRKAMKVQLEACPKRNLLILDHVETLEKYDRTLQMLDIFLDPLNGERGQFHYHELDSLDQMPYDTTNMIVIFLYHLDQPDDVSSLLSYEWRDFLSHRWKIAMKKQTLSTLFTPDAVVGRLSDGIELLAPINSNNKESVCILGDIVPDNSSGYFPVFVYVLIVFVVLVLVAPWTWIQMKHSEHSQATDNTEEYCIFCHKSLGVKSIHCSRNIIDTTQSATTCKDCDNLHRTPNNEISSTPSSLSQSTDLDTNKTNTAPNQSVDVTPSPATNTRQRKKQQRKKSKTSTNTPEKNKTH